MLVRSRTCSQRVNESANSGRWNDWRPKMPWRLFLVFTISLINTRVWPVQTSYNILTTYAVTLAGVSAFAHQNEITSKGKTFSICYIGNLPSFSRSRTGTLRCLSAAVLTNTIMWFARGRHLRRLGNGPMKIADFGRFVYSHLECDLHQKLTISRLVCKEYVIWIFRITIS